MGSIEKVSLNLSDKLGAKLNKTKEEKSVLNYGLFIILHTLIGIILTFFVGIVTGTVIEIMSISITTALLKRYTGGVHATTPERCAIIGVLLAFILSLICKYLVNTLENKELIILITITLSYSYYILYKKCPVPSKNKPIKKETTKKRMRKKAFELLNIYLILILMLMVVHNRLDIQIAKTLMIAILLGITLQMSVLTSIGSKFINKLDNIFNIINSS
ncbi:MAG: accessory gene regulator B family protein [Romboutsia sp.]